MSPTHRCQPPNTLKFGSFPRLLDALPVTRTSTDLEVDLSNLRWIEALSIAVLVAFMKDHLLRYPRTDNSIFVPRRHEYLQRMDFFKAVGAPLPENFKRRDPTGRFVPVREVNSSARVPEAAEEIVQTLQVGDLDAARTLRHCVGEIVDNVFVHSRSPVHAVICAQHFPNAHRSQVAIVDTGIGFLQSFTESPAYAGLQLTDRDVLVLGRAPFVTSKPSTSTPYAQRYGRLGVGLFIVSDVLARVGGRILLVSGTSAVDQRSGRTHWRDVKPWQGTIVGFEVPDEPIVSHDDAIRAARERARELSRSSNSRI